MKLDLYDKKILAELDSNARVTATSVAKKIRLPKETVNYRIKRLLESGYINKVYTIFNSSLLGYSFYKVYLRFKNLNPEMEEKIVDFIQNQPRFANLRVLEGSYDMVFLTVHKTSAELRDFLQRFYASFGNYVLEKEIHKLVKTYKMNPKYLFDARPFRKVFSVSEQTELGLDKTDQRIIELLSQDARMKLVDIAQVLGVDPRIVRYRIKKMEEKGIIVGYTINMNLERLQQQLVEVNFSLKDLTIISSIIEFFDRAKVCVFAHELIGKYDLSLELYVKDYLVLRELLKEFREQFLDGYVYYEIGNVYREYTINWSPFQRFVHKQKNQIMATEAVNHHQNGKKINGSILGTA